MYQSREDTHMPKIKPNHPWRQQELTRLRVRARMRHYRPEPTRPKPPHCELCRQPHVRVCIDHCHDRGKFRGWLCPQCNIGLGALGDTLTGLRAAVTYLERAQ